MDSRFLLLALIPLLPLAVAAFTAFVPARRPRLAAVPAVAAQAVVFGLSVVVFAGTLRGGGGSERAVFNFQWFEAGSFHLPLGVLIDPLTAAMLVMVTFVSLLVFVFSLGSMAGDPNRARFFCFLSLFSAGMLGVVVSNSLLLLFVSWEIVGLSSYLLIGFWFTRPAAADAARKAFLTTRIGDIGLFLGMLWLQKETGTLLFYDGGAGCLDAGALDGLAQVTLAGGLSLSAAIALLIFCGAAGKSGQFPLHVWLPDAMEGPTPVSALIHAATMVAAGVFLVARVYPLFEAADTPGAWPQALVVVAWTGAFTALFAGVIAAAQFDIKRILAYSTVSQLGVMMLALGVGGWAAAVAHLIAHAFFKALLFLGAGSVLHGAHHEQDIRRLGGLRRAMPVTFATYAVGMMALAGFPVFFSGFWTKEAVLHAAHEWPVSQGPFLMVVAAAFFTAFYMSRQAVCVFFGAWRGQDGFRAHESPRVMLVPLGLLAAGTLLLSLVLTPAWPWFAGYVTGGGAPEFSPGVFLSAGSWGLMLVSVLVVGAGVYAAWRMYGRGVRLAAPGTNEANPDAAPTGQIPIPPKTQGGADACPGLWDAAPLGRKGVPSAPDPLEKMLPAIFRAANRAFLMDNLYDAVFVRGLALLGALAHLLDRVVVDGAIGMVAFAGRLGAAVVDTADRVFLNDGFRAACARLGGAGRLLAATHSGRIQIHLRAIALGVVLLLVLYAWMS